MPVPRVEATIVEHRLEDAGNAARGLGVETTSATCRSCGAEVAFGGRTTSEACVFCGTPVVLELAAHRNALRPESVVPLDVTRSKVEAEFRRWLGALWFRPTALRSLRSVEMKGVYVPAWTFDARAHSDWSADAGYYYYVTVPRPVMVNGRMQIRMVQERRVRWEPACGSRNDAFDDLLVHGSRALPGELLGELGSFQLAALVPYRPEYLAGWHAEEYGIDLEEGWKLAQTRIAAAQETRCSGDVPGDTQRSLQVHSTVTDVRWKLALLPVWSLTYRFAGRDYRVLAHGQSGKVVGKAPVSWIKILLFVLALMLGVGGILALMAL